MHTPLFDSTPTTLVDVLEARARLQPDDLAYVFLSDDGSRTGATYRELALTARRCAAGLQRKLSTGDRALLVYPAGLDFVFALFGCLYAGVIPVPASYPKPRRPSSRLAALVRDSGARVALTNAQTLALLQSVEPREASALEWIALDKQTGEETEEDHAPLEPWAARSEDVAFLQYTSGSTTDPKGVMVTHGNLLHNLEMIRQAFQPPEGDQRGCAVCWLPAYHDMGLIGGILEPLYVGRQSVLMSPQSFLRRPLTWLEAISEYRATGSAAPNFAYELCVEKTTQEQRGKLDLSSWQIAFCGAEPIRVETLERFTEAFRPSGFRPETFFPCYGLAEATLLVTGNQFSPEHSTVSFRREALAKNEAVPVDTADTKGVVRLVSCGSPFLDQEVVVVDPDTCRPLPEDRVGEIWIRGDSVARGYWLRPQESESVFRARLAGESTRGGEWLRTGDFGIYHGGRLFITGRSADRIIIRGRNYYPQDLEQIAAQVHPALRSHGGCAFTTSRNGYDELVIVHEIDRQHLDVDTEVVARRIRGRIADEHELEVARIVLVRQTSLPRTTSGKIQRAVCKSLYLNGDLRIVAESMRSPHVSGERSARHADGVSPAPAPAALAGQTRHNNGHAEPALRAGNGRLAVGDSEKDPAPALSDLRNSAAPAEQVERWLVEWIGRHADIPRDEITSDRSFFDVGLDSLAAVELSQQCEERLGIHLPPVVAWNYPTPASLAAHIADKLVGGEPRAVESGAPGTSETSQDEVDRLLSEIESLSDSEAEEALDLLDADEQRP